jgi:hypothetical protein
MPDLSHTVTITVDLAKVRQAAANLGSAQNAESEIEYDPQAYLAKLGVDIDGETANAIKQRFAQRRATAAPAAILHIDV